MMVPCTLPGLDIKAAPIFVISVTCITVDDVLGKVRNRILYRLNKLSEGNLGSEIRLYEDCPSDRFPEDVKKPRIELFAFKLAFADGEPSEEQKNTAILFGVENGA